MLKAEKLAAVPAETARFALDALYERSIQLELVQLLLHKGARAGAKDAEGRTPLQLARLLRRGRGDEKMVAMLEYANQNQAPAVQPNW